MKTTSPGFALLTVIAFVAVLLIAGIGTITLVRSQLHYTADQTVVQGAYHIAEAGIQRGIAQLDNDASTATTAGYVYPSIPVTSFGGGSYTVTLAQDPLYPSTLSRKLISSTATFKGKVAMLAAHVLVQAPQDPCSNTVMYAAAGNATVNLLVDVGTIFTGDIFSNQDVHFVSLLAALPVTGANSHVYAVGTFYSDSVVVLAVPRMSATLTRASYSGGLDLLHLTGFHFSNGANGHGAGPAPTARGAVPIPDWDSAKRDSHTIIVNQSNYASISPSSSWTGGVGGTWNVNSFTLSASTRYYVDGSVNVASGGLLQLLGGSSSEIWARGNISIDKFTLISALSSQNLTLVAQGNVVVGGGANGFVNLLNTTKVLAYAYGGNAQLDFGAGVAGTPRACIIGGGGTATYRALAGALAGITYLR